MDYNDLICEVGSNNVKIEPDDVVLYGCQVCKDIVFEDYEALEKHLEEHIEEEDIIYIKQENDNEDSKSSADEARDCNVEEDPFPIKDDAGTGNQRLCESSNDASNQFDMESGCQEESDLGRNDSDLEETGLNNMQFSLKRQTLRLLTEKIDGDDDDGGNEYLEASKNNLIKSPISEEKEFECEICCKKFARKHSLIIHLRVHTGERPYTCDECGSSYKQSGDLTMHLRSHIGLKPFMCEVCNATFLRRGDVNRHMMIHNKVKPFQCEACSKCFTRPYQLKLHWQNKHSEKATWQGKDVRTGEKVKGRVEKDGRRFECEVCKKTFKDKSYLKVHSLLHTGHKPLKCEVCNKTFAHSGSFNIHKRIHTGEKPYSCRICKKRFNCSSAVGKHYRRAHIEETQVEDQLILQ